MSKKKTIAVAVTPDRGLEVAEMDYASGTISQYTHRDLDVITIKSVIPDLDVFKDLLSDCFTELSVTKGSSIILSLPTVTMGVGNYMASQSETSIVQLITDDLIEKDLLFRDNDPLVTTTGLNVTIQSKIMAYTAAVYSIIQEAARIIVDLGYKVEAIDVSVASTLRALIHTGKVQPQQDTTWLLLLVDNMAARLLAMNGDQLTEYKEEQIMYDFSDTAENCDMVVSAMTAYLEKLPAKYLFIVSRTNNVSAEMLASKIKYSNPVIFLEANTFSKEAFINAPALSDEIAKDISLDVIGACMYDERLLHFNLFNEELGDVYLAQQPPQFKFNGSTIVLTNELLVKYTVLLLLLITVPLACVYYYFNKSYNDINEEYEAAKTKLDKTEASIKKYEGLISTDVFSEADEIRIGVSKNTEIYNYFDLLGREMPAKLWLTSLVLSSNCIDIEGRADNIESIYSFFRNIKDTITGSSVKLQKLALASVENSFVPSDIKLNKNDELPENEGTDITTFEENANDIILSSNADFYEFIISDKTPKELKKLKSSAQKKKNAKKNSNSENEE